MRWLFRTSSLSAWVAAAGLCFVLSNSGPEMAAAFSIYGGAMEATVVRLPFPWLICGGLLALSLMAAIAEPKLEKRWLSGASIALSLAAGVAGIAHIREMMQAAGSG